MSNVSRPHVVGVGAGFCSLAGAYALGNHRVCTTALDVGVAQWAVHSIREVAGTDARQLIGNSPFNREVFSMQSWKQSSARVFRFAAAFLARPRFDDFTLFAAALAILGTILVLFRQVPYGAGITGDTVAYISTARNLLEENRFVIWNGNHYTGHPPLFPLLLALIGIFGHDPLESAGRLNAVVFGLTIFVSALYLRRRIQSRFLLLWTSVALVASWPLATVCFWAQTEASFIFFTILSLFSFDRFLDTGNRPSLVRAAIFTALACLDRYVGVTIVGSMALLLWQRRGIAVREKIGDSLVYTIIAMFPLSLWFLRNFLLVGNPTGYWNPPAISFQENIASGFATFGAWIVGPVSFHELAGWFTATFGRELTDGTLGVVLVTVTVLSLSGILSRFHFLDVHRKIEPPYANSVAVFVGFTISYLFFITLSLTIRGVEPMNTRYLAPVYVPMMFILVFSFDAIFSNSEQNRPKSFSLPGSTALMICLCSWLLWQAGINIDLIRRLTKHGAGYASPEWTESETIRFLNRHLIFRNILVWSNDDRGMYIRTNVPGAKARHSSLPTSLEGTRRWLGKIYRKRGVRKVDFIVWLYGSARPSYDYRLADLLTLPGLEPVTKLADGIVLRVGGDGAGDVMDLYRTEYLSIVQTPPVIRSSFNIHLHDDSLTYVKASCTPVDVTAPFFLHVTPRSPGDLPVSRQRWSFDNRDFDFYKSDGIRFDGKCLVTVPLPRYDMTDLSTGQYNKEGKLWEAALRLGRAE